jgi:hypothetical protein
MNKLIKVVLFCLVTTSFLAGAYEEVDGITATCDQACQDFHARQYALYRMQLDMLLMEQRAQNDITDVNSAYQPPEAPVDESLNNDAVTEDESQEETRQDCIETVKVDYNFCKVIAQGKHLNEVENNCSNISNGGITLGYQGNGLIISDNDFPSCLATAAATLELDKAVCELDQSKSIQNCPSN